MKTLSSCVRIKPALDQLLSGCFPRAPRGPDTRRHTYPAELAISERVLNVTLTASPRGARDRASPPSRSVTPFLGPFPRQAPRGQGSGRQKMAMTEKRWPIRPPTRLSSLGAPPSPGATVTAPSFPAARREVRPRVKASLPAALALLSASPPGLSGNSTDNARGDPPCAWQGSAVGMCPPSTSGVPALRCRRGGQKIPSRRLILGAPALQTRAKRRIRDRAQGRTPHSRRWSWGPREGLPSIAQLLRDTTGLRPQAA